MKAKTKNIAILLPNHFDGSQFQIIKDCVVGAGGNIVVIGRSKNETITDRKGEVSLVIEQTPEDIKAGEILAMIILDSSTPEEIKASRSNLSLILKIYDQRVIIGTLDRGVELLVAALGQRMNSHKATGPEESRIYLEGAGATIVDRDVVTDGNIITARSSQDAEKFCKALLTRAGFTGGMAA